MNLILLFMADMIQINLEHLLPILKSIQVEFKESDEQ